MTLIPVSCLVPTAAKPARFWVGGTAAFATVIVHSGDLYSDSEHTLAADAQPFEKQRIIALSSARFSRVTDFAGLVAQSNGPHQTPAERSQAQHQLSTARHRTARIGCGRRHAPAALNLTSVSN